MFDNYCLVDVETTGGSPLKERIIEIGIIKVENGDVRREFSTLINPEVPISPFISNLTGISDEELASAPRFEDVASQIFEFLKGAVFVAHNVGFDYGFIRNEFRRIGVNYDSQIFCTARFSKLLYPEYRHHNLSALIDRYGFSVKDRHRAYDDAKVLYDFLVFIQKNQKSDAISEAIQKLLRTPYSNPIITDEELADLPEKCGVYIFYTENKTPLYIERSLNIRKRIIDHLRGSFIESKAYKIFSQVSKIEYHLTEGELSAYLLEQELRKEHLPIHKQKRKKKCPYISPWLYSVPQMIREIDLENQKAFNYKILDWRIISKLEYFGDSEIEHFLDLPFDYEAYKIIKRYL